jgi:hypothetical protein
MLDWLTPTLDAVLALADALDHGGDPLPPIPK